MEGGRGVEAGERRQVREANQESKGRKRGGERETDRKRERESNSVSHYSKTSKMLGTRARLDFSSQERRGLD